MTYNTNTNNNSSRSNNNCKKSTDDPTSQSQSIIVQTYLRYIPPIETLSLQSDAPGYNNNNNNNDDDHDNHDHGTNTNGNFDDTNNNNITTMTVVTTTSIGAAVAAVGRSSPIDGDDDDDDDSHNNNHCNNNNHNSSSSSSCSSNNNNNNGPICWKCRGTGQKKINSTTTTTTTTTGSTITTRKKQQRQSSPGVVVVVVVSSLDTDDNGGGGGNGNGGCLVCHGTGRCRRSRRTSNSRSRSTGDDGVSSMCFVGLITRGRRRSRRRLATTTTDDDDDDDWDQLMNHPDNNNNNTNCTSSSNETATPLPPPLQQLQLVPSMMDPPDRPLLLPVGYTVPYYGPLVRHATIHCQDVRIRFVIPVVERRHSNTTNGPPIPSTRSRSSSSSCSSSVIIQRIDIGNSKVNNSSSIGTGSGHGFNNNTNTDDDDLLATMNTTAPTSTTENTLVNTGVEYDTRTATTLVPPAVLQLPVPAPVLVEIHQPQQVPTNIPIWLPIQPGQEQLCNLVGHWRILQKYKSHRYTTDDVVTAVVACRECLLPSFHSNIRTTTTTTADRMEDTADTTTTTSTKKQQISYCDLGTGNGSVLQMVLWKILSTTMAATATNVRLQTVLGLEARKEAVQLLRRSLSFNIGTPTEKCNTTTTTSSSSGSSDENNIADRVSIVHTDFRSYCKDHIELHNQFDVVTGTPPYFQVDFHIPSLLPNENQNPTNGDSIDAATNKTPVLQPTYNSNHITATIRQGGMPLSIQSAPARCEFRGGIEAYCVAACYLLKPNTGMLCICENYMNHQRALQAFVTNRMKLIKYYIIEGKVGRGPLFCVYVVRKMGDDDVGPICQPPQEATVVVHLAVRDERGEWTEAYQRMVLDYMTIIH